MPKTWIVARNELYRYFISPLAYVYLIAFLLLNGSFAVYFGDFFNRGQADLSSMFAFQPWIYLIFIPGISMRLWAEEFRQQTIVQIMTLPVPAAAYVWGKFLASWLFCGLALLLTFPFWLTVNWLGNPDNGVILGGYLGSFLLAGCMLAISQTMSALTKNQVIALVLSVIANLLFFLSGVEYVLSFFRAFASQTFIEMIASFSFLTHFQTLANGLLELRDLFFFGTVILLFNFTTILIVGFKTSGTSGWLKSTSRNYYIFAVLLLLCGFTGLNLIANSFLRDIQYDFTAEKIYTLSPSTKRILGSLPRPVVAKLYYTPLLGQRNPEIRLLVDKLYILLRKYSRLSGGKFNFAVYHPQPLDNIEDQALAAGLQPIPLIDLNQNGFLGLTLTDEAGSRQVIPLFPLERQNFLEQDLTSQIFELFQTKPTLGIISGLPVFDSAETENGSMVNQEWEIIKQIRQFYNIKEIKTAADFPDDLQLLMLIHPHRLKPEIIEAVTDYTLRGGNSLVLLDTTAEAPRIFSPLNNEYVSSDLGELSRLWHFNYFPEAVVADLGNSITVDATTDYKNNPNFTQDIIQFAPRGNNLNRSEPETARLKSILFASASVLKPDSSGAVNFVPLIKAGNNSALMPADVVRRGMNPSDILRWFKPDNQEKVIAAKIISRDLQRPFTVIAVADTDFIYDSFWTRSSSILDRRYTVPLLDNGNFILNALESLSGTENLTDLRGKTSADRPFADIEKMRRDNQLQFKLKESEIFEKINQTKAKLSEIWNKKSFEGRDLFSADELAVIANYRRQLDSLRLDLAANRKELNTNIEHIANLVKLVNIYLLPGILLLGLAVYLLLRRPRTSGGKFRINAPLLKLGIAGLFLLGAGLFAAGLDNRTPVSAYENKLIFPRLDKEINQLTEIELHAADGTLTFVRSNNLWTLREKPDFPVYQERIRRFLNAMLEARYYEKRTADPEYLAGFGLTPPEAPGSRSIRIILRRDNRQILTDFEVGDFNIDIGRGTRGAYLKFPGQFQVWLARADFIDLSVDWRDWTYSTLWNLRFGRIADTDKIHAAEPLTLLVRDLLTTPLLKAYRDAENMESFQSLDILTEDRNQLRLLFYRRNGKYYVRYLFDNSIAGKHLQFFAGYAKSLLYEIPALNMEKIEHDLAAAESGTK